MFCIVVVGLLASLAATHEKFHNLPRLSRKIFHHPENNSPPKVSQGGRVMKQASTTMRGQATRSESA
jgi:hypothetical protein